MNKNIKIAVIGGGGRTGKFLVDRLLAEGYQVKLLLRNPETAFQNIPKNDRIVEIVKGDVLDYDRVTSLIEGCSAVISTVGQRKDEPLVASRATSNILKAMSENRGRSKSTRYILLAGLNVNTPFDKKGSETQMATEWMKTNFTLIHEDRQKAYEILASSEIRWTLVRVPYILFTDEKGTVGISLLDSPGKKISAGDIADFLITQLDDETYIRKAPFIADTAS